ncbi:hypothetical protein ACHQM5_004572 [Ranunculus cassubicifolius]
MTTLIPLFIFLALTLFSTPEAAHQDEAVNYWKSFYPTIPIPSLVSQHMSQMSDDEINTVITLFRTKTVSANISLFCKTAGLICSADEIPKDLLIGSGHYMPSTITVEETKAVFFHESTLKKGTLFNMGEIKRERTPSKAFLPHSIASLLTLEQSGVLFQNTTVSDKMSMTINMCKTHIPGEIMKCTSSVEELVQFSTQVFSDTRLKILHPKSADGAHTSVLFNNIRPLLRENSNAKFLVCHELFFPYTVMYCHAAPIAQVYQVDLVHPKTRKKVNDDTIAVCHYIGTRPGGGGRVYYWWSPNENAISIFRTLPGNGGICHWLSTASIAFVHLDDTLV